MSIWYQQPDSFTINPSTSRRWGFSAIPNSTRSPFSSDEDGTFARSANAMYGLMPDHTPGYGGESDEFMSSTLLPSWIANGNRRNPFAGIQFTDCS